jgi:hypothetical protein
MRSAAPVRKKSSSTSRRGQPLIMTNYFRIRDGKIVTDVIPVTFCHE